MGTKAERTRERILDAAASVLSDKGYARMRLSDVAAHAGIQTAAIYYYFPSRDDLVEEVMYVGAHSVREHVVDEVRALPDGSSTLDKVLTAVAAQLRYELQLSDYTRASIRNIQHLPDSLQGRPQAERRAYSHFWRDLLAAGMASGEFRSDLQAGSLRMLIMGALNWVVEWWQADVGPLEDLIETAQDMVRRTLLPT